MAGCTMCEGRGTIACDQECDRTDCWDRGCIGGPSPGVGTAPCPRCAGGHQPGPGGVTCHQLKTHPAPFLAMLGGIKRFEFRQDDRGYAVGDLLHLREWRPTCRKYTGRQAWFRVDYILCAPDFGVPEGYVVMSVSPVELIPGDRVRYRAAGGPGTGELGTVVATWEDEEGVARGWVAFYATDKLEPGKPPKPYVQCKTLRSLERA